MCPRSQAAPSSPHPSPPAPPPSAQLAATTQRTPCMHPCCATTAKEKLGEREPPQPPRNIGPGLAGPVNESDTTPTRVGSSDGCHFAWLSSCLSSSFFSACVCVPRDCAYCGRRATVYTTRRPVAFFTAGARRGDVRGSVPLCLRRERRKWRLHHLEAGWLELRHCSAPGTAEGSPFCCLAIDDNVYSQWQCAHWQLGHAV